MARTFLLNKIRYGSSLSVLGGVVDKLRPRSLRPLAILLSVYVCVVIVSGISTANAARSLANTEVTATISGGSESIEDLEQKLARFDRRWKNFKALARPSRILAHVVVPIPVLNRQRQIAELLIERVDLDSELARETLHLGDAGVTVKDSVLDNDDFSLSEIPEDLTATLVNLRSSSDRIQPLFERINQNNLKLQSTGGNPVFDRGINMIVSNEQRLTQMVEFSQSLADVLLTDFELVDDLSEMTAAINTIGSGTESFSELSDLLDDLAISTEEADRKSSAMLDLAPSALLKSDYGQLVRDVAQVNRSAAELVEHLNYLVKIAEHTFEVASLSTSHISSEYNSIAVAMGLLAEEQNGLDRAAIGIESSIESLLEVSTTSAVSLGGFGDTLNVRSEQFQELSSLLVDGPSIGQALLGLGDESRYRLLVLGQTSDEIRAAGGFTSSAWILTFEKGALVERKYLHVSEYEDLDRLDDYPEAAVELQLHMNAGRMYLRDVGWDPHFPSVAQRAAQIVEITSATEIDGVLALSQWGFTDLVSAFGGVDFDGKTVSGHQLMEQLQSGTDEVGTQFLRGVFDVLLDAMSGEVFKERGLGLAFTIRELLATKDLMLFAAHPELQSSIVDSGWDGGISLTSNDRLAIVDSNIGWNKIDRNILREFEYTVDLSDREAPIAMLSLDYENLTEHDSDRCQRQEHVGGIPYPERMRGCYWNLLRVYLPVGAELVSSTELPVPSGAIASRISGLLPGTNTAKIDFDVNGPYFSGLVVVAPGKSEIINLAYRLPSSVAVLSDGSISYSLEFYAQSGIRNRVGEMLVITPLGYQLESSSHNWKVDETRTVRLKIDNSIDQVIELVFRQS